ncbi:MAG: hypothetical protein QXM96_03315 [Candidatus Woesearchaeota archaeon]
MKNEKIYEKKSIKNLLKNILIILFVFCLFFSYVKAQPTGADVIRGESSRGTGTSATTQDAQAGNVTGLIINQTSITRIWQGFYGNVSGQIVLENSAGNNFYDWTLATVTGQVYASRKLVPDWSNVNCTNSTQWESEETTLNIPLTSVEGINETFSLTTHPAFSVGSVPVSNCRSTRPYNSSGLPGNFWNVLINTNLTNTVYVSVLSDNSNAFDGGTADFELLVPTDRNTGLATYYFYAELN